MENLSRQLLLSASENALKVAYEYEGQSVTYEQFNEQVNRFASSLEELGVQKGDHVALLLGNSPEFLISYYGALRIGAVVIPINPIYTAEEVTYILSNGNVKAAVAVEPMVPLFENVLDELPDLEFAIIVAQEDKPFSRKEMKSFTTLLNLGTDIRVHPQLSLDDIAVILYTSGTTGKPKGAMLTHENLMSNARDVAAYLNINKDDKVIAVLPMFHVFCMTVAMNAPISVGATLLVFPKFSPQDVFQQAKEKQATVFAGVPTMYNFLLQSSDGHEDDFGSIRLCISGGASLPVALLNKFEEKFNVRVSEGYGLSEASPVTCFNPLDRPRKAGSIGKSITNVENKVVNAEGEEVPVGEVGELVVNGPNVMKGYYKMPEETEATIKNGWLYTGDLAKVDEDGYFYIVDRKKDMILVGGYNVYPREVEEVLYDHPDVLEVAVVGVPDPDFGEAVQAFVVPKAGSLTENDALDYCKDKLAKYKVPKEITFLDELPKNTTGKILRRALRDELIKK
ncbi:fatty acid--CoA ligase family protein [Desertibacillus haloalkaliphilus]|uniref:fatty acid--CoA ligase family protein n=1 Tax=Desertibacillus haloalkaliphilus TaxID=1328930 RepID=UPI001C25A3EF|nr:fatty acid--CoA ligase family protein [Desertibacillus haloalkaliphilus]MBU8907535.1 fatty acid--CoA ligase family protein [Desertibacillus haloalkaliphilus]